MARAIGAAAFVLVGAFTARAQWTQLPDLPLGVGVYAHKVVAAQGQIFVLGGLNSLFGASGFVYRAPTLAGGSLGTWSSAQPLPGRTHGHGAAASTDRVYVLGGWDWDGVNLTISDRVHFATITPDGSLGSWVETTPLPHPTVRSSAVVVGTSIYLTGGLTAAGALDEVVRSAIHPDGSLGPWVPTTPLPEPLYAHAAIATDRLYVLGGFVDNGYLRSDQMHVAPILPDQSIGPWTTVSSLPQPIASFASVAYGSRLLAIGGDSDGGATSAVFSAAIDPLSGVGAWLPEPSLPQPRFIHDAVVVGDYVYVLGGDNGSGVPQASVYSMNLAACTNDVFVDSSYSGPELGTQAQPFDTIFEGLADVCDAGTLWIAAGDYDEATPLSITRPVALKSTGGAALIR